MAGPAALLAALGALASLWAAEAQTSPTKITGMSPSAATDGDAVTVSFSGAGAGDQADFALAGTCASASPSTDVSGGSASFTLATGTYDLCLTASGETDSVKQTSVPAYVVSAATSATAISAISPTEAAAGAPITIALTGAGAGDLADFASTGTCSSTTPGTDVSSGSASFTLSPAGSYILCFTESGSIDSVQQTSVSALVVSDTSPTAVSSISPTSTLVSTPTTITLTGVGAGDLADFATTGNCGSTTPATDVSSGSASFTLNAGGSYDLCLRQNGNSDSIKQTGIAFTVYIPTSPTAISAISPTFATTGVPASITLTGAGAGDLADFALTGTCGSTTPGTDVSSGSASFTLAPAGSYDLCYTQSGSIQSVKQTSVSALVVTDTSATAISSISPTGVTVGVATVITLTGAGAGDRADFATTGNCGSTTPGTDVSSGSASFTLGAIGTYDLCFRQSGKSDSIVQQGISLSVTAATSPTEISAISPTVATTGVPASITLTGAGAGDLADFAPTGTCGSTTPGTDVSSGSASFTLSPAGSYDLCFTEGSTSSVDSVKQTSVSPLVVTDTSATGITSISPTTITATISTTMTFAGAAAGDLITFTDPGDCHLATPDQDASSGSISNFVMSTVGTYDLCLRSSGNSDSVKQLGISLSVQTSSSTKISSISPVYAKTGASVTVTFSGATAGDLVVFTTGPCSGVTPSTDVSSGSAAFTFGTAGVYYLCLRESGLLDSIQQASLSLEVTDTDSVAITAISPTTMADNTATAITLTGASAGDLADFTTPGTCGSITPSTDVSSGSASFTLTTAGPFDLCLRQSGNSDSVKQRGILLTVPSPPDQITSITPASISVNWPTTITFAGVNAGDKVSFSTPGNCDYTTPSTLVGSGSATFTVTSTGTFEICYRANGNADSVTQIGVSLTVMAGTDPNLVTSMSINTVTAAIATPITLYGGPLTNGLAVFAPAGTCASANPVHDTTSHAITANLLTNGNHDLCYREEGRTDSVAQSLVSLLVIGAAVAGAGNDPVTSFGGVTREFFLPPGVMTRLLEGPDVTVAGETFEGGGPWEQWFGRMRVASPDGQHWLQIAIRKDLLHFNRSSVPRGAFETLEVTLGRLDASDPSAVVTLPGPDFAIPESFLGAQIVFRKVQRNQLARFPMIGSARRECMDFASNTLHFIICSAAANEYYGPWRHLAIQYAHLDLVVHEVRSLSAFTGVLPELWGLQPLSNETAGYVQSHDAAASRAEAGEALDGAGSGGLGVLPSEQSEALPEGAGWAGGKITEDLQKSCLQQNQTILAI